MISIIKDYKLLECCVGGSRCECIAQGQNTIRDLTDYGDTHPELSGDSRIWCENLCCNELHGSRWRVLLPVTMRDVLEPPSSPSWNIC